MEMSRCFCKVTRIYSLLLSLVVFSTVFILDLHQTLLLSQENITVSGYSLQKVQYLKDLDAYVYYWIHDKSQARLIYIKNSDQQRYFSVSFKTPPFDDSGVFHLIEHAVVAGSKKYPVRNLFQEVQKNNIVTDINALTYQDQTRYYVSSPHLPSFLNLVDVYLDCIFNPLFMDRSWIFYQEGIRRELHPHEGLKYNGVVYNEMLSVDMFDVVREHILHNYFEGSYLDHTFAGDPVGMSKINFSDVRAAYEKYYHPSNSLILFYGDMDIASELQYIDSQYLSKAKPNNHGTISLSLEDHRAQDRSSSGIQSVAFPASKGANLDQKSNLYLTYLSKDLTPIELAAHQVIFPSLFEQGYSQLRRRIMKHSLCEELDFYSRIHDRYTIGIIELYGVEKGNIETLSQKVKSALKWIFQKGVNPNLIRTFLLKQKFVIKSSIETKQILQTYVDYINNGWLYNDDPYSQVEYLRYIDELLGYSDEKLSEFVINLIDRMFFSTVQPSLEFEAFPDTFYVTRRNQRIQQRQNEELSLMSTSEVDRWLKIDEEVKDLASRKIAQKDLDVVPAISLDDLSRFNLTSGIKPIGTYKTPSSEFLTYTSDDDSIEHIMLFFDLSGFSEKEIIYLSMLVKLYKELPTKYTGVKTLGIMLDKYGSLTIEPSFYYSVSTKSPYGMLYVNISYPKEFREKMFSLVNEILESTRLEDSDMISALLQYSLFAYNINMSSNLDPYVFDAIFSNYDQIQHLNSLMDGKGFYDRLKQIMVQINTDRSFGIIKKLNKIRQKLLDTPVTVGIVAKETEFETITTQFEQNFINLKIGPPNFKSFSFPLKGTENIGFVSPTNNANLLKVANLSEDPRFYDLILNGRQAILLSQFLEGYYFHPNLRGSHGAYTVQFLVNYAGLSYLYVQYDPDVKQSLKVLEDLGSFMKQVKIDGHDDIRAKILAASSFLEELDPVRKIYLSFIYHFMGISEKSINNLVNSFLTINLQKSLRSCSDLFSSIADGTTVVISNEQTLEGLKQDQIIDTIEDLNQ